MRRLSQVILATLLIAACGNAAVAQTTIPVTARSTFLRTSSDPGADTTIVVNLQSLGIRNGMVVLLERLGDYTFFNTTEPDSDYANAMVGVFSFTSQVLPGSNLARVPAALSTTLPGFVSAATLFGNLPTDIPQDFGIGDSTVVRIPAGGSFLMISSHDVFYGDNRDPDGDFAIRITVLDSSEAYPPAACLWNVTTNTTLADGDLSREDCVVMVSGATLTIAGRHRFTALSVVNAGVVTSVAMDSLRLAVGGDVVVAAGAKVSVNGRGYAAGRGSGAGQSSQANGSRGGGGGHGGAGGMGHVSGYGFYAGGPAVGSFAEPESLGSGGGAALGGSGGNGGGVIHLLVAGELRVDGSITADGDSAAITNGGGAGGSISLSVGQLTGAGVVAARGGNGAGGGGGGGGGRIAVLSGGPISFMGQYQAFGGLGYIAGGAGTVLTKVTTEALGTLLVDNGSRSGEATTFTGSTVIPHSVRVKRGGSIAHPAYPGGDASGIGLDLRVAGDMTIEAGGAVSVNGRGYAAGRGSGAGQSSQANGSRGGGGGHGGAGGMGHVSGYGFYAGGPAVGSFAEPESLGSGGGAALGGSGGNGGGVIHLLVAGELRVDGSITADGDSAAITNGGGAGGSISLSVGQLTGAGVVAARGGNGAGGGGGGGGGRIAVLSGGPISFMGQYQAFGGLGYIAGGAGTVLTKVTTEALGTLLVDNGSRSGEATTFTGSTVIPHSVRVKRGGSIAHPAYPGGDASGIGLDLRVAGDMTIEAGGAVSVNGRGYAAGRGSGAGQSSQANGSRGGGGGHGGAGGMGHVSGYGFYAGGPAVGSFAEPESLGSGGGAALGGSGGNGGGVIHLLVAGELRVDGSITADGDSAAITNGGGAGGSISLSVGQLTGAGVVAARGGNGAGGGGGGGGGRIAVLSGGPISFMGQYQAFGGLGYIAGGAGTVLTKVTTEALGTLLVDNGSRSGEATTFTGSTVIPHSVRVKRGGSIAHPAYPGGDASGIGLDLRVAGDMTIEAGGAVSVNGRGYAAGRGSGAGQSSQANGSRGGGGGHGGAGGMGHVSGYGFYAGGPAVGSFAEPESLGSGGGAALGGSGGNGGGVIHLLVAGELRVDGSITADGDSAAITNGGGAGGSISLSVGQLTGAGVVAARGGNGAGGGGGGGGGRIAIYTYCWPNFAQPQISVAGGTGFQSGQPGTIYPNVGLTGIAAGVVGTADAARHTRNAESLELGGLESDDSLWVFRERGSALPPPTGLVAVDISQPGTVASAAQFTPATIDTGTYVNSHVVHFDPVGDGSGVRRGSITFDTNVLGIIVTTASLNASDPQLKRPELDYATGLTSRGAEFDGSADQDTVTLSADRRTVTFVARVGSGLDEIRVVTAIPPGSCGAVDAPPRDPVAQAPPRELSFAPPAPNPARGGALLSFGLPHAGRVSLDVYDVLGRRVASLVDGVLPAGHHTRRWDGTGRDGIRRDAGVYFIRLTTVEGARTQRLTLVR